MDVKLNDIQRKIKDDQMNVIDKTAKRFVEIEVRAGTGHHLHEGTLEWPPAAVLAPQGR